MGLIKRKFAIPSEGCLKEKDLQRSGKSVLEKGYGQDVYEIERLGRLKPQNKGLERNIWEKIVYVIHLHDAHLEEKNVKCIFLNHKINWKKV